MVVKDQTMHTKIIVTRRGLDFPTILLSMRREIYEYRFIAIC